MKGIRRRDALKVGAAAVATLAMPRIARASGTVRYWTWLDPKDKNPRSQVQQAVIEAFQKNTGTTVNVELVDWRTISQQVMRAVAANEGPDLVRLYSANLPEQVAANNLAALDEHMAKWPKSKLEDIGPPLLKYDGKTVAMYIENRAYMLYYRDDMLKEKGLSAPKSFADIEKIAAAIADDKRAALIWPASQKSTDTFSYASPMIWAMGGDLVGADKKALFNGTGAVKFYTWLQDLVHKHKAMPATYVSWDEEQLQQSFNAGTCAMAFMGTNRVLATRKALTAAKPEALQVTHAPSGDGTPPPVAAAGWTLAVPRTATNIAGGFALLDALTDTEAMIMNAKEAGEMPIRKSALADPWFSSPAASEMKSWIEYIAKYGRDTPSQKLVKSRELNNLLNKATQEIVLSKRAPKEALDEAAAEWNKIAA
jgi:multiple sugar transport system substrate-binding protein